MQKRGADRKFVTRALELGSVTYSVHKRPGKDLTLINKVKASSDGTVTVSPSPFMKKLIEENGGRIKAVYALLMTVPHMFSFHTERKHDFIVDLYVIEKE